MVSYTSSHRRLLYEESLSIFDIKAKELDKGQEIVSGFASHSKYLPVLDVHYWTRRVGKTYFNCLTNGVFSLRKLVPFQQYAVVIR